MGTIITFVVIGIVLNILRRKWAWMDYLMYIVAFLGVIGTWSSEGFIEALGVFFVMVIIIVIARGSSSKVNLNGKYHDIECENCEYNKPEIISKKTLDNGDVEIFYHCPRCDTFRVWVYGKRK